MVVTIEYNGMALFNSKTNKFNVNIIVHINFALFERYRSNLCFNSRTIVYIFTVKIIIKNVLNVADVFFSSSVIPVIPRWELEEVVYCTKSRRY